MLVTIFKYQILLRRQAKKRVESLTAAHLRELDDALDRLARIAGHVPGWFLLGGLAWALTLQGRFYRRHSDIDLGVEAAALPALVKALQPHGYRLFRRVCMGRLPGRYRFDILHPISAIGAIEKSYRHLRLWRVDQAGVVQTFPDLLNSLDLLFFWHSTGTVTDNHGFQFPGPLLSEMVFTTSSGAQVRLCHRQLVEQSKSRKLTEVDRFDLAQSPRRVYRETDAPSNPSKEALHDQVLVSIGGR